MLGVPSMLYPHTSYFRHLKSIRGIPGPLTLQGMCRVLVADAVPECGQDSYLDLNTLALDKP